MMLIPFNIALFRAEMYLHIRTESQHVLWINCSVTELLDFFYLYIFQCTTGISNILHLGILISFHTLEYHFLVFLLLYALTGIFMVCATSENILFQVTKLKTDSIGHLQFVNVDCKHKAIFAVFWNDNHTLNICDLLQILFNSNSHLQLNLVNVTQKNARTERGEVSNMHKNMCKSFSCCDLNNGSTWAKGYKFFSFGSNFVCSWSGLVFSSWCLLNCLWKAVTSSFLNAYVRTEDYLSL